ncbi:glutamate 5-kinase [Bermanella marisrubri]|uniref:Glutamate 5-kinase n=1 Tax=Bermanella marisrubri TaxID=207949 RepID=Q1MZU5_9GAMM|nr:glutamate 5-kinase [Bermanella marisrubri]EAT11462.1 gamma-glutamyl kinase [Oceanobacter sp. RED65] [Bermanella marisrubri]QIZ85040.1 glutamate 5-kinase [Bermanella marisrubri]
MSRQSVANAKRIVIKIGSALLTNDGAGLNKAGIANWVDQIAELKAQGKEIILVSSGSVAEGMTRLGWSERPTALHELQAAAAVGQMGLVQCYESNFSRHQYVTAQVLLTHADLSNRTRYLNARSAITSLLSFGVVPIINENDTVITDEIRFGDNDTLGALVANLIEADALIILTDQDGLYTADPRKDKNAKLIEQARAEDPDIEAVAGGGGKLGRGGMTTKVRAAKLAARSGCFTVIVGGRIENVITRLNKDEVLGTLLCSDQEPMAARKQWLAGHLQTRGQITLDPGAVRAVIEQGRSLLSVGVVHVDGNFGRGEVVACINEQGQIIAKGLINYNALETQKIMGKESKEILDILGYMDEPELIHRDNLVLV